VSLTIAFASEPRIIVLFVDILPVQVSEPRFDIPRRNAYCHTFIASSSAVVRSRRLLFDLVDASCHLPPVGVDHHQQCLLHTVTAASVELNFFPILVPHELLSGTATLRADFNTQVASRDASPS
jgi:hypothetical protein